MTADKTRKVPPPRPVPVSLLVASRYSDEQFWRGFKTSASAHAVLAISAMLLAIALPHSQVKFLPSIRVDLVSLPDVKKADLGKDLSDLSKQMQDASKTTKTLQEKAKKLPAPAPVEAPDESMALKKEKPKPEPTKTNEKYNRKDLSKAIDRMKALAAIEAEDKKSKPKAPAKGNKLSAGDSTTGGAPVDSNLFISKMTGKLRDNWNLPVWLSKQNLDAKVVVFLDRAGYVSNTIVAKSSGNQQFDAFCLKTIRMAQPFGEPPADIISDGLTLGFPL